MPRIPIIEQTIDAPETTPSPRASGVQVADGLGNGIGDIAASSAKLSQSMAWQEDQDAKVWAANTLSKAHLDSDTQFTTMQQQTQPGAAGFTPKFLEWQDKYNSDALENAPDDRSRTYLAQHLATLRTEYGQKAVAFEAGARQDWRTGQMEDAIDNTAKAIQNNPSKDNFLQLYAQQKAVVDALEVEPQKKQLLADKLKENVFAGYWLGRIQQDPYAALDDLKKSVAVPVTPDASHFVAPPANDNVEKYASDINANAQQYGVDPNFMRAQLAAESNGNPNALNTTAHNGQPSVGIAQFEPETAKRYGIDPTEPDQAIKGQAAYMSDLLKQFGGDYQKAAAAYNWGEGNVQKAVDTYGDKWLDAAPQETKTYVKKIFGSLGTPTEMLPSQIQPEHLSPTGDSVLDGTPFKLRIQMMQHAETEVNRQTAKGKAQLEQDMKDANTSLLTTGAYPNAAAMTRDRFIKFLGPDEGQRKFNDFQDTLRTGQSIAAFNTMPAADISANIQAAAPKLGSTVTPEQEKNFKILQEAGARVLTARTEDPIGFGVRNALIPNEPLNFSDTSKLSAQLSTRAAAAKTMAQSYGTPLAVFTKSEAEGLTSSLDGMTPNAQLGLFKTIRDSVNDPEVYRMAIQQIRPDSPVTAMAGSMVGMDAAATVKSHWFKPDDTVSASQVARYMLEGEALLNPTKIDKATDGKGKTIPMPSDDSKGAGLRPDFNDFAGDVFRNQPQAADTAYQGARAVYAALSSEEGDYSGVLNEDRAQKAIKMTLGTVAEHNGKKVLAPYGMNESAFLDLAKAKFDDAVNVNKFDPKTIGFGNVSLENTGNQGRYYAQIGAGYLIGRDGRPVVIDVTTPANPKPLPTVALAK